MYRVMRMRLCGALIAVVLGLGAAAAAGAATLEITSFSAGQAAVAKAALQAFQSGADGWGGTGMTVTAKSESFEGYAAWDGASGASNPGATAVGSFASLGGVGTGGSSINGGSSLQVRNDASWPWGRQNVSGVSNHWLDSNDTYGMSWSASGVEGFNALAFLLTDVADVGAKFSIRVGGELFENVIGAGGRTGNGSVHLVRILLPSAVDLLQVELRNDRLNDGFGIDGATIAKVAPVPVPPAVALVVSGFALLFGLGRRRSRAA